MPEVSHRPLAHSAEDIQPLHQLCREGRLYDVERWIADGKPLQLTSEALPKGARLKTALQIALQTGQHSLATLLLQNGYRLELERYAPLDLALRSRRWDLFDLLLEGGGDLRSVDVYTVLETYNSDLYERFRASGGSPIQSWLQHEGPFYASRIPRDWPTWRPRLLRSTRF